MKNSCHFPINTIQSHDTGQIVPITAPLCPQIGTATVSSWSQSEHGCYLTPWQQFQSLLVDFTVNKMHQNVIDDRIVLLNSGKYWGIRIACSSCQFLVTAAATAAFSPFPVLNLRFCVNCSLPSYCNILTLPTTNIYCSFYKHSTKLQNILETEMGIHYSSQNIST